MSEAVELKSIIEALLFVSNNPITDSQLKEVLVKEGVTPKQIESVMAELNQEYADSKRSFRIEQIAGGWQLRTQPEFGPWVKKLLQIQRKERFSAPALETLAVIAYKQPITKTEIEAIRGVNIDWVLSTLVEKGIVRTIGRKDVPGRPFLYGTSTKFLEHFGLSELKDLPQVEALKPKA